MARRDRAKRTERTKAPPEEPATPTTRPTAYTVFPSGFDQVQHPDKHLWCLTVTDAGDGWAIRRGNTCLNYANQWEFEPPPAIRAPDFLRRCRYNQHAALQRARRLVDHLHVEGMTFNDFAQKIRAEQAHSDGLPSSQSQHDQQT